MLNLIDKVNLNQLFSIKFDLFLSLSIIFNLFLNLLIEIGHDMINFVAMIDLDSKNSDQKSD